MKKLILVLLVVFSFGCSLEQDSYIVHNTLSTPVTVKHIRIAEGELCVLYKFEIALLVNKYILEVGGVDVYYIRNEKRPPAHRGL